MKDYGDPTHPNNDLGTEDYDMGRAEAEELKQKEQELYKDKVSASNISDERRRLRKIVNELQEKNLIVNNDILIPQNEIMPINPEELITKAIENGTAVDVMERLLAMRRELKEEAARDEYFRALAGFQYECPAIEKRKAVYDKDGQLRYKYAPLDDIVAQVKGLLVKYGFSYTIKTEQVPDSVTAICQTNHRMGHSEDTSFLIPIDAKAYMNIAQKVASALTYAKRYAFCDAFGIMTADEDDDAGITGEPGQPVKNKKTNKRGKITYSQASEECQGLYSAIMALFREKISGQTLFTPEERTNFKKSADDLLGDHEKLVEFYKVINKLAQAKRNSLKAE